MVLIIENDWKSSGHEMDVLTAADVNLMMSSWMYSRIDFCCCDGISDQGFPNLCCLCLFVELFLWLRHLCFLL